MTVKSIVKRKIILAEKKQKNKSRFNDVIPRIVPLIMESTDKNIIQHIYLFGSYAYGRPNKESDLDIAVVLDNIENSHEVYGNIALKLFHENIMPLDLLVYTEKEFYHGKNPESIENTIMEKGEILYVREKNSN